jgi:hypothetical protein
MHYQDYGASFCGRTFRRERRMLILPSDPTQHYTSSLHDLTVPSQILTARRQTTLTYCGLQWGFTMLQFIWRLASSGILRRVALVNTDLSEEPSASFIRAIRIGELKTTLAVTSNRRSLRRNTACVGC